MPRRGKTFLAILWFSANLCVVFGDYNEQCPVPELSQLCESVCTDDYVDCIAECGEDQGCISGCNRAVGNCFDACPCHRNCFDGCAGCENEVCANSTTTTVPPTTTAFPENKAVLILNQFDQQNVPVVYNVGGELNQNTNFQYGAGTGSDHSCSAVLNGRMFIIGGRQSGFSDQISEVTECTISRIGTLPSSTAFPACNTFKMTTEKVWICFYLRNRRGCKSFDGNTIVDERSARRKHYSTSLGVFDGSPFALGGYYPNNREAEHFKTNWTSIGPYPFVSTTIYSYSTVTLNNAVYIFGGYDYDLQYYTLDLAAKYDGSWERVGSLLQPRRGHRSLVQGSKILHIGGNGEFNFEQWTIGEDDIQMENFDEKINIYYEYPESFWIQSDYCT